MIAHGLVSVEEGIMSSKLNKVVSEKKVKNRPGCFSNLVTKSTLKSF